MVPAMTAGKALPEPASNHQNPSSLSEAGATRPEAVSGIGWPYVMMPTGSRGLLSADGPGICQPPAQTPQSFPRDDIAAPQGGMMSAMRRAASQSWPDRA